MVCMRFGILIGIAAALTAAGAASAATYYVDAANGSDASPGTFEQPFKTIGKAAGFMLAGDTCLVRRGTYRETVAPAASGRADARITFKPYANEDVVISGCELVTGWAPHQGAIWKAPIGWDLGQGNNEVFVNGAFVFEARWPDSADLSRPAANQTGAGSTWTSNSTGIICDDRLTQPPGFWNNAVVYIRPGRRWYARTAKVIGSTPGQLNVFLHTAGTTAVLSYENITKYGGDYFITGTINALDSPGEWFHDGTSLYLWGQDGGDPGKHAVEAKKRKYGFDLSGRAFVTVEGFRFFAMSIKTSAKTTDCVIDGIDAKYIDHFTIIPSMAFHKYECGILLYGTNNEIRNSRIAWSAGNGITVRGTGHRITNCEIHDVAYAGIDGATINTSFDTTSGHVFSYCTLYNSGRSVLIHCKAENTRIVHNRMYNAGLQMTDLGVTYTIATDGKGSEIAWNVVHGCAFSGIYLDNNNGNYNVHHNVVYDVRYALHLNRPSVNNWIVHNTVGPLRPSGQALAGFPDQSTAQYKSDMSDTVIRNNIFRASSWDVGTDPPPTKDHNIESTTDPKFADQANNDYQLQAGSPAIDAGIATPFTGEFAGKAPDCGAFEFGVIAWIAGYSPPGPKPPRIGRIGDKTIVEHQFLAFSVIVIEPDGDPITYAAGPLPAGVAFDSETGVFSWTPATGQAGVYPITFSASDKDGSDSQTITITVNSATVPPDDFIAYWRFNGTACDDASARIVVQNHPVGDANDDCTVDVLDLIAVQRLAGQDPAPGQNWRADLNGDGRIDALDLAVIRECIGRTCPQPR